MRGTTTTVKSERRYDGTARRRRAEERRSLALAAAGQMFLRAGYHATTVEAIAAEAGVSAATIYKTYGGKSGLLRALCAAALAGDGPVAAADRSDALRAASTPAELIDGWGALLAEVSPRVSPLLLVLQDAARTDPEVGALQRDLDAGRLARMRDNAIALHRAGPLRPGIELDEIRDVLWLATAPELYDLLVRQRGWSVHRYARHVTWMMRSSLLGADPLTDVIT